MRVRVSAVFEREGEILCMKYVYGGKEVFSLPGGGVDQDIPLQEAIVDEWRDELGVKLEAGDIIMIGEAPATKRHPQTLHIIFEALEIHGTPRIRSDLGGPADLEGLEDDVQGLGMPLGGGRLADHDDIADFELDAELIPPLVHDRLPEGGVLIHA
ncbi:MAG TPA: NUDIX hydrolase, partial [Anaerolineales bacterium]